MKQSRIKRIIELAALSGISLAATMLAPVCLAKETEKPPTLTVGVFARHVDDKIMYLYWVKNNTEQSISAVSIGRDSQNDNDPVNDVLELIERPSGWNLKYGIPASSYNAPNGWRSSLTTYDTEETDKDDMPHAVTWEPLNDKSPRLDPGGVYKFTVTLDQADTSYLSSHALIVFSDGNPASMSIPIDVVDDMPPSIEVVLSPNTLLPQNEKPAAVKASFIVKDDYDTKPQIKLESITSEQSMGTDDIIDAGYGLDDRYIKFRTDFPEESGRVYTVTYSATDATGNQALGAATITIAAAQPVNPDGAASPTEINPAATADPAVKITAPMH